MKKNEGISKRSIQSLILFFADPNSKDSIQKNIKRITKTQKMGGQNQLLLRVKAKE